MRAVEGDSLAWGSCVCLLLFFHDIILTSDSESKLFKLPGELRIGPCHRPESLLKNLSKKHVFLGGGRG